MSDTQDDAEFMPLEVRDSGYICPRIGPAEKDWDIAEVRLPNGHITDVPLKAYKKQKQWCDLFTAAGTAAHEAAEMGYDPVEAVEGLPVALEQVRCAIIDLLDGPPGNTSGPAVTSAVMRLAGILADASDKDVSEIIDDKMLDDALESAEGTENQ